MKRKCVFVIGPEGSGSTLIAKLISTALNNTADWNGRGFNCCNEVACDKETGYVKPHKDVEHLVCHRSLPFMYDPLWPPVEEWRNEYDAYFVICTRDINISKLSIIKRFGRKAATIDEHHNKARAIITNLLQTHQNSFVWSYESFMFLREAYFKRLLHFLGQESNYFPEFLNDANLKYLDTNILTEKPKTSAPGSLILKNAIRRTFKK